MLIQVESQARISKLSFCPKMNLDTEFPCEHFMAKIRFLMHLFFHNLRKYSREMKQLWHASHDLSAFIASYGPQWVEQTVELIEKDGSATVLLYY